MGLFMKDLIKKTNELIKKFCTKEVILYAVFGVLTTIVNWGTFAILTRSFTNLDKNIANAISIIVAVLIAYITNKDLVFPVKFINKQTNFTSSHLFYLLL